MAPPAILPGSSAAGSSSASSAQSVVAQPVLSRSLQSAISTMHARCNKVFATASPLSSPDLPSARAAVLAVVHDGSIGAQRPLPAPLREVLSAAINPPMQSLAKKCHGTEHYSLLLGWLYQLAPLLTETSIALEWWDFLIKPVLRDVTSCETAQAQAKSLVLETMCNAPADAYQDVPAPNTPWPKIENTATGNFARKVGDAPYSTFASGPAPPSTEPVRTPGSSVDSTAASPTFESSLATARRRAPPEKNTLYRFAQRITQLYFSEIASTPHVERKRTRTRQSSGASPGHLSMNPIHANPSPSGGTDRDQPQDAAKSKADLSGLGLIGLGADDKLPKSALNGAEQAAAGVATPTAGDKAGVGGDTEEVPEEEDQPDGPSLCWSQRLESIVLEFGTRSPKRFFHHLSYCFAEPTYRIPVLVNLIAFISAHPATAYHLIATPLPAEVLMSLQIDTSTTVVSLGVRVVVMLLPHIPVWFANGGGGGLPALMAIFARIIDWRIFGNGWEERVGKDTADSEGSAAGESAITLDTSSHGEDGAAESAVSLNDEIINRKAALDIEWMELDRIGKRLRLREDVEWSRLTSSYDGPDTAAPNAVLLFTYIYGLFPANAIRFLRAPIDYLRKAHYVSPSVASFDELINEILIQERSGDIVRQHRLHDGLVLHNAEWEVCSAERWKKSVTEEYAAVCINHFLGSDDYIQGGPAMGKRPRLSDQLPVSAPRSGADTPTAHMEGLPSSSMLYVAMKPSLSAATIVTPALSISSSKSMSAVHRENLMLRTELNYELNLKGQLLNFIGKLHTNKLNSHIMAAEQQNLKSEVKVLRAELDRSRKERDKIREEAEKRAKRLGNPQQRLRTYMEKDRQATEQLQKLTIELQSKEETNKALSAQLEAVGTELFELKAIWQQKEPALRELDGLKAHIESMQQRMQSWADNEVRYTALEAEMRTMASKWAQLELERDTAEAAAREAIEAREAAEVEKEKWIGVAESAAAQLKSLQEKWTMKPPTLSAIPHHQSNHHAALTPTSHMHASGAVFSASSPSSPMLQASGVSGPAERASRRQSMIQAASARLLAGNSSAASALLSENVRLAGAMEDMQAEMLALKAELAVLRSSSDATSAATAGAAASATAGEARGPADLEDIDVLPLDIGPAAQTLSDVQEAVEPSSEAVSPQRDGSACPDYVFTTLRIFGGSVEGGAQNAAALSQRLLPAELRSRYLGLAQQSEVGTAATNEAELEKRIPLLSLHLQRLRESAAAMRKLWPDQWVGDFAKAGAADLDKGITDRVVQALKEEITQQQGVLVGQDGELHDLRARVEVSRTGTVKVTTASTPPLVHEREAQAEGAAPELPKVKLDTKGTTLFSDLGAAEAEALATCKTSARAAYTVAAERVHATYGAGDDDGACFDGLLWTSASTSSTTDRPARRLLTESTIANIVLEVQTTEGERKFVSPVLHRASEEDEASSGSATAPVLFLPGLFRTQLVQLGLIEEADLPIEAVLTLLRKDGVVAGDTADTEVAGGKPVRLWLCNSLRGLFEVQVVA